MEVLELMSRIQLPEDAQEQVKNTALKEEEYQEWRKLFYKNTSEFFEKWKKLKNRLEWALVFYLRLSAEVYEEYKKKGISDEIFDATFYDITIWCIECHRKYSVWGLAEVEWISVSVQMKLYRLGRLQFEPMILSEDMIGKHETLKAGTSVLGVHIPAGEKLDVCECKKSFAQAKEFFGNTYEAYVCDSWLLSPTLKEFLPETSNIVKFQNMFEIVKVHHKFPQAEQRIFQDIREDKENYPEDTLLQKKAKEYILSGKDIGIGVGMCDANGVLYI